MSPSAPRRPLGTGSPAASVGAVHFIDMGNDAYQLCGDLTFESVPGAWEAALDLLKGGVSLALDLRQVSRTDSAGLALLVECMRVAKHRNARIRFENIPPQLLAIAKASRLDGLLPRGTEPE